MQKHKKEGKGVSKYLLRRKKAFSRFLKTSFLKKPSSKKKLTTVKINTKFKLRLGAFTKILPKSNRRYTSLFNQPYRALRWKQRDKRLNFSKRRRHFHRFRWRVPDFVAVSKTKVRLRGVIQKIGAGVLSRVLSTRPWLRKTKKWAIKKRKLAKSLKVVRNLQKWTLKIDTALKFKKNRKVHSSLVTISKKPKKRVRLVKKLNKLPKSIKKKSLSNYWRSIRKRVSKATKASFRRNISLIVRNKLLSHWGYLTTLYNNKQLTAAWTRSKLRSKAFIKLKGSKKNNIKNTNVYFKERKLRTILRKKLKVPLWVLHKRYFPHNTFLSARIRNFTTSISRFKHLRKISTMRRSKAYWSAVYYSLKKSKRKFKYGWRKLALAFARPKRYGNFAYIASAMEGRLLLYYNDNNTTLVPRGFPRSLCSLKVVRNNSFLTLVRRKRLLVMRSCGMVGFKGKKKRTDYAVYKLAITVGDLCNQVNLKRPLLWIKYHTRYRASLFKPMIRGFMLKRIAFIGLMDKTPLTHNGMRKSKAPRK